MKKSDKEEMEAKLSDGVVVSEREREGDLKSDDDEKERGRSDGVGWR